MQGTGVDHPELFGRRRIIWDDAFLSMSESPSRSQPAEKAVEQVIGRLPRHSSAFFFGSWLCGRTSPGTPW